MISERIIRTERLCLRHFTEDDLDAVYRIYGDEEANTFLPWHTARDMDDARRFLEERYLSRYRKGWEYAYAICLRSDDVPIGYIKIGMDDSYDLGYAIRHEFWHQGVTTEAGRAFIQSLREDGIPYVTATHDRNNPHSGRVMRNIGMSYRYSYQELWQPKGIPVVFRMYQLNLDGMDGRTYMRYWEESEVHFVEGEGSFGS